MHRRYTPWEFRLWAKHLSFFISLSQHSHRKQQVQPEGCIQYACGLHDLNAVTKQGVKSVLFSGARRIMSLILENSPPGERKNVLANLNITKDTIPMFPGKPVTAQAFVFKTRGFQSQPCVFLSGLWEALLAFYCWNVGELWMTAASGRLWCAPKPTETQSPDHRLAAGSLGHLPFAAAPIPDLCILFFLLLLALCTISSL